MTSVRKLAIFVEGYTELNFVDRLVGEIAGAHRIRVELRQIRGGSSAPKSYITVKAALPDAGQEFYVLIVDCGGDRQVKTRIVDEHEALSRQGYFKIIGLRDVRPDYSLADVPKLEAGLRKYIRTSLVPVEFVLAIMEIEAWFISEATHFERIEPSITIDAIRSSLGFDPESDDICLRPNPAGDLDACYQLAGISYEKGRCRNTIDALSYENIYLNLRSRVPHVGRLVELIDEFMSAPSPQP